MTTVSAKTLFLPIVLALAAMPASAAGLFSLAASGTISSNSSGDSSIPIGTPWTFEVIYDTAAPDGSADPTFGDFTNTSSPPALTFFHYQAGSYEVTIDDPADFGANSGIHTTFTSIHAIDININAAGLFPPLAGGAVSFHADFNDFSSRPIFVSDALPTNTALSEDSFDANAVTLLPPSGDVTGSTLTSLAVTPVPEPSGPVLSVVGLLVLLAARKHAAPEFSPRRTGVGTGGKRRGRPPQTKTPRAPTARGVSRMRGAPSMTRTCDLQVRKHEGA